MDKNGAPRGIAEAIKEGRSIESALKRELSQEYSSPLQEGFSKAFERLTVIKHYYCQILTILGGVKDAYPPKNQSHILGKIQAAKNAYIVIDQVIETIKGIKDALKLAPIRFFE